MICYTLIKPLAGIFYLFLFSHFPPLWSGAQHNSYTPILPSKPSSPQLSILLSLQRLFYTVLNSNPFSKPLPHSIHPSPLQPFTISIPLHFGPKYSVHHHILIHPANMSKTSYILFTYLSTILPLHPLISHILSFLILSTLLSPHIALSPFILNAFNLSSPEHL